MMPYRLAVSATKDIRRFPEAVQAIIIKKIEHYSQSDNPLIFAKSLKDNKNGSYRFRIGDYRAIFDVRETTIIILRIGHRREIYK